MSSAIEHYEKHLAPVYSWMAGDIDVAIERGQAELEGIACSTAACAISPNALSRRQFF